MGNLVKLAGLLLVGFARTGNVRDCLIRTTAAALCATLAAVLALAALGCAATALWIFALPALGPVGAPLVVAAVLSTLILVLAMAIWLIHRGGRRQASADTDPQLLLAGATRLFSEHRAAALLAAVVAGVVAGTRARKP